VIKAQVEAARRPDDTGAGRHPRHPATRTGSCGARFRRTRTGAICGTTGLLEASGELQYEQNSAASKPVFQDTGVDLVGRRGSVVYRTKDDSSARKLADHLATPNDDWATRSIPARIGRREVSAATPGSGFGREVLLRRHQEVDTPRSSRGTRHKPRWRCTRRPPRSTRS